MNTILIPIDFSTTSYKALEVGAGIAQKIDAKLVLIHMAGLEEGLNNKNNSFEQAIYYSKVVGKKFEELEELDYLKDITVEPVLQKHLDLEHIDDYAKEISASLILMGSQGSKGLNAVIKGSNAEKVVRHSSVPVLVVKDNDLNFAPDRILYASDFDKETVSAYTRIKDIASLLGARLDHLYINLPGSHFKSTREMDETLIHFFQALDHPNPVQAISMVQRYADYSVEQGIMNYVNVSGADIIAIPTHGRTGLSHFLKGSISEDITNHALQPVLTVKM